MNCKMLIGFDTSNRTKFITYFSAVVLFIYFQNQKQKNLMIFSTMLTVNKSFRIKFKKKVIIIKRLFLLLENKFLKFLPQF